MRTGRSTASSYADADPEPSGAADVEAGAVVVGADAPVVGAASVVEARGGDGCTRHPASTSSFRFSLHSLASIHSVGALEVGRAAGMRVMRVGCHVRAVRREHT